jgi:hypothetical protein
MRHEKPAVSLLLGIARSYLQRGWMPLPVPFRSKNPGFDGWQNITVTEADLPLHFNEHRQNIGVLLGRVSGDLADVDLDCTEAISLAPYFLPATGAIFGRQTRPRSHWLYVAPVPNKVTFTNPVTGKRLVEILTNGQQAIFPGSAHKDTGELVQWYEEGEAARISATDLIQAAQRLASATLLAQHWPQEGSRQDAALALAGGLLRADCTEDEAAHFIEAVCRAAQDEETHKRVRTVVDTVAKLQKGAHVTGWPTLAKIIDNRVVDRVCEWLAIRTEARDSASASERDGSTNTHGYTVKDGCLARWKPTRDGQTLIPLCNFAARIVADVIEDDGAAERRVYEVQGKLASRHTYSTVNVSADEFGAMRWMDRLLGAATTVYASQSEHVRCAVRLLSDRIAQSTIYTHTGWREIDGYLYYLHSGGAIGGEGNITGITVRLPDTLSRFELPDPPRGNDLVCAIRHHLNAAALADTRLTYPLFGACWASVLGDCDFALHLSGDTGAGKSEIVAIAQSHFGKGFDREHLPASWSSTGNSLERLAHAAKDAVLIVDDFAPAGTPSDTARLHREADRLLRAQGNQAGRLRLKSDTSFNAARAPRGLIISTGEDIPSGSSLRARMWVLEVEKTGATRKGSIDFSLLTETQRQARAGVYSGVTAAFAQWLAPRYAEIRATAPEEVATLRNEFAARLTGHKRHATTMAKLMRAWSIFLTFARDVGALSDYEKDSLIGQMKIVLLQVAARQETHQASQDPATRFLELIVAALNTGQAHISSMTDGEPPFESNSFGWRNGDRQGKHVGWTNQTYVYLQPDAAFSLVSELSNRSGSALTLSQTTLWKRLYERTLLVREEGRETLKSRVTINGRRLSVVTFKAETFHGAELCDQTLTNLTTEETTDK